MKMCLLFCLCAITLTACNSNTGKDPVSVVPIKKDSLVSEQKNTVVEIKDSIRLRDIELNEKNVLGKKYNRKLDRAAQKRYSTRKLDPLESNGFNYYIYDSLYSDSKIKVLLLSRTWPEENIVWLAIYDASMQLTDFEQVYYDNSEGALSIETSIKNDLIKITTNDSYEEAANAKKIVSWYIDAKNKLVKK